MTSNYVSTYQIGRGLGTWRSLFLNILSHIPASSILEAGAGSPAFLKSCVIPIRMAVDLTPDNAEHFRSLGISFVVKDLNCDTLTDIGKFDVAVCSDVFEHLLNPMHALHAIYEILNPDGLLFSHVPNEFALRKILKIMFGYKTSVNFHKQALPEEWNDPHLRRFTDIGYKKMLETAFRYNIKITKFRYSRVANLLAKMIGIVPYTLEKGPTYVSTNSPVTAQRIESILREHEKQLHSHS